MDKKIGIVTWFTHTNFGTLLQVTASSHFINKLGYDTEIINYHNDKPVVDVNEYNFKFFIHKLLEKVKNRSNPLYFSDTKSTVFHNYIHKNLNLSKECSVKSQLFELNDEYGAFVCGSDQVWSPVHFDPTYYLDFVEEGKRIAFAPSLGLSTIHSKNVQNIIKTELNKFSHISVREEEGKSALKDLTSKDIKVLVDPTFLLTSKEWDERLGIRSVTKSEPYILCYFLGNNKEYWDSIRLLQKKTGYVIKILPIYQKDLNRGFEIIEDAGPREFVELIKNAEIVCTDSFHGMIFSMIYHKLFISYKRFSDKKIGSQNSRIDNLLRLFNAESSLFKNMEQLNHLDIFKLDYNLVDKVILEEGIKSKDYIVHAINSVEVVNKKATVEHITNTCSGCGVCENICPTKAINISCNEYGFKQSVVNQDMCIGCERCIKTCGFRGEYVADFNESTNTYMLQSRDEEALRASSSGGAAYEFTKWAIENEYQVIGCSLNEDGRSANHILIDQLEDIPHLQGSKYLQSDLSGVLKTIKLDKNIMIIGLPCQIEATRKYLKLIKFKNQVIFIDLICHGVPTNNLWLKYLEENNMSEIKSVNFRDKKYSWHEKHLTVETSDFTQTKAQEDDLYLKIFSYGMIDCSSCYECKFRRGSSADIRIGDFWGPKYQEDTKGVSIVLSNTDTGEKIINDLIAENKVNIKLEELSDYFSNQAVENSVKPIYYYQMLEDIKDGIKLESIYKKYVYYKEKELKIYRLLLRLKNIVKRG